MSKTPNLGLVLPAGSDWADVETLNANWAKLDAELPGSSAKEAPTAEDSVLLYDSADSAKPKKALLSKLMDLWKSVFYTKAEVDTSLAEKAPMLLSDRAVYVSPAGSDSTGNGSSANPFATLEKALSVIPKNLGGKIANVYFSAGTYDFGKTVVVDGFYAGLLRVQPTSGAAVTITNASIQLHQCHCGIAFSGLTMTNPFGAAAVFCTQCYGDIMIAVTIDGAGKNGCAINAAFGVTVRGSISNCAKAITVVNETPTSIVAVYELSGTGNTIAYDVPSFILVESHGCTIAGTKVTSYGGRIFTGVQS